MVGFLHNDPIIGNNDLEQDIKNQTSSELKQETDPFDIFTPDLDEFSCSFADSFLDFDSLKDFLAESPTVDSMADVKQDPFEVCNEEAVFGTVNGCNEVGVGEICEKVEIFDAIDRENEVGIGGICEEVEVFDRNDKVVIGGISEKVKVSGAVVRDNEVGIGGNCEKADFFDTVDRDNEVGISGICKEVEVFDAVDGDGDVGIDGICGKIEVEKEGDVEGCEKLNYLNLEKSKMGVIEKMGKVSINSSGSDIVRESENISRDEEKNVTSEKKNTGKSDVSKGGDSDSESDIESSSCSSLSEFTSSDEGGKRREDRKGWGIKGAMELEEGEIQTSDVDVDEMVAWSEDEEEDSGVKGPIRSKNELPVLPPVPIVNATLLPHHQTLPVGVVSAILGAQVVVEGVEKHNPLSDGSILWITESRSPLGIVDEIFGPVKNPYYIVRYNSESEVPAEINQGTLISFVPEFANHVLNDGSLYKKGYDASGENDEEVSADEEFSDDEKEAEYKRILKMKKRGTNDEKVGNKKKDKKKFRNRSQNSKCEQAMKPPVEQSQNLIPPVTGSSQGQRSGNRTDLVPSFHHPQQAPAFAAPSSGVWTNIIPNQQPGNMGLPNTLPTIGMPWQQQCHPQQMFQMPLPNGVPLQQQFNPGPPHNFILPFLQPDFGTGQAFAPWPALGQNGFNQPPFALGGLPGQLAHLPFNMGGQIPVNVPQAGANNNSHPPAAVPAINSSLNFNQGNNFGGGWNANFQGGGSFGPQTGDNSNSQQPAAVPAINSSLNFNQSNHFVGGWNANFQGNGGFGPQTGDSSNSQQPAAVPVNGPETGDNNNSHPPAIVPGNTNGCPNFNQGNHFGGGWRGNGRGGGGRFGRGRGRGRARRY
ncbi:PREDICTED: uncharacterized protein LOC109211155 [Nicotiana attenuata]|uniref:H/ACA ribonucleoprotein complex non-core subunit NAF1 n=1 Tax=Nicotiana attenuata TaxID=49451 RepID=A0A314KJS5_NICAT|nr:PREDICTED: uncharacterized protein LOC109211155 [Nicotiana attenuata]OIT29595.1 hypothetical protein A4A49_32349 [Nicotiana attenuata]